MCGIVGLFTKTEALRPRLGALVAQMLIELGERGPDSAGVAVYRDPAPPGAVKVVVHSPAPEPRWDALAAALGERWPGVSCRGTHASHAVLVAPQPAAGLLAWLAAERPDLDVMSVGDTIEIYKEAGRPAAVVERFGFRTVRGTHALGHTRMATESAVSTVHSHPFSTGLDLCLVHNGSLSNHNGLRRRLERRGIRFRTDNDSEVAAGYLAWRLREGAALEAALADARAELDGFYTFAVGTRAGFAVLRDPIACKPAVLAETADWVAMASEFRAIAVLPGADTARIWEPEPGRIYTWSQREDRRAA